ncbi:response regulator transcription factor [Moorella naiadis]|uniref:response regulator transcription factor n=1 Tax=Moorella naiadis (nom. illeg.) TaxID=3093670 RepID=UPI003D9C8682
MDRIRVLVVDDHEVVRLGLVTLLSRHQELEIVGEAGTAAEAVARARELLPQVVVMDIRMPDKNGIEACREIREIDPGIKVIMLTSYADDEALFASIMAGAAGYVLKDIGCRALVDAIITVGRGGSLLDPGITGKVLDKMRTLARGITTGDELNEQEKKILALIGEGKTNRQIAAILHLSEKTVRNYVSSILAKLNLSNRAQAAVYMARQRFTGLDH